MTQAPLKLMQASETIDIPASPNQSEFEDFIYLISHDVRNSVRALIELPQWIEEDLAEANVKLTGSVAQTIEMMNCHTARLDRMLVDLLTFSRIGRLDEQKTLEVDMVLTEVLEEIRLPSGFKIRTELFSNKLFMGERDAHTLLMQLTSNSFKHHDQQKGEVLLSLHEEGDHIVLRVQDDGPGIPPQFAERVFAAMTTLRPRDEVEGSGMGLAIVRKIAQNYGGRIKLGAGLSGRGTMVEITFPKEAGRFYAPDAAQ